MEENKQKVEQQAENTNSQTIYTQSINNTYSTSPQFYQNTNQYNMYYHNYNLYQQPILSPLYYEKKAVAKTGTHIGAALLLFYLFVNLLQVVVMIGFSVLQKVTGNSIFSLEKLNQEPAFLLLLNVVLTVVGFGGAAFCLLKMQRRSATELISFQKPQHHIFCPMVFAGIGGCYVANVQVSMLAQRLSPIFELKQQDVGTPQGLFGFLISVLASACAPALIKEFLFRGAIMGSLKKFGEPFAVFTSAVLFGLVHGNLIQIPFAFLVGLILGFAVVKTGSIWTGVCIHFINNFLAVLQEYAALYFGEEILTLFNFILMLAIMVGGLFAAHVLNKRQKDVFSFQKTAHASSPKQRFGWIMSRPTVIIFLVITAISVITVQLQ